MGADKFLILRFLEVRLNSHILLPQTPVSRIFLRSTVEEGQVGLKLNGTH
jgi:hypothetical protein